MGDPSVESIRRVLIASANPLFAKGLQKMVAQRWASRKVEIRLAGGMQDAIAVLDEWQPELVIVDYDDAGRPDSIQRGAFLSHFIAENRPMQVMLVSLRESGEVVVYDRRTLTPAQAEDWLDLPWTAPSSGQMTPENEPVSAQTRPAAPAGTATPAVISKTDQLLRSGGMKPGGLRDYIIPSVLTLIFTFILGFAMTSGALFPTLGSTQFGVMVNTMRLQIWIAAFLFSLITVFVVYSAVVYRHRPGDSGMGANFSNAYTIEAIWTIVPIGLVIFLAFLGTQRLAEIRKPDPNALQVKVTGYQWGWLFEYPDQGDVKSNQLYLPVNRQVHLVMTSRDVIHSFWVPEFGVKQDLLPGANLVKELRINPTRIGQFTVYCNQLCGGAHAYMVAPVRVVSTQDFDAWIASKNNTANQTPEQRGQTLAQNTGCVGCHSVNGSKTVGPTWKGLAGSQAKLTDGTTVSVDDAYLHESIVEPNKHIAAGFAPGIMPQTYKTQLNEQQIQDIIAFIKTLK